MQEDFRTKIADFAETAERIAVMMQPVRWNWLCLS
jgi:hypothetical protein